jgi:hypothetical protein
VVDAMVLEKVWAALVKSTPGAAPARRRASP